MPLLRLQCLFILLSLAAGYTINYYAHKDNGPEVKECMDQAIIMIQSDTCLEFEENPDAPNAILFIESDRCGYQDSNATIHVSSNCADRNHCKQFLHHAITGEKQHYTKTIRHLNTKFNCTEKCSRECSIGGILTSDCTCKCNYGFYGDNCDQLRNLEAFTEDDCGYIDADKEPSSVISIKEKINENTYCQWILKSEDPFSEFQIEVEQLDLDDENVPPGGTCGDSFYIFGLKEEEKEYKNPISCLLDDGSKTITDEPDSRKLIGKTLHSKKNYLIIELRGNRFSSRNHKGPVIKYTLLHDQPMFQNEFPSMKYEHVTASAFVTLPSIVTAIFTTMVLFIFSSFC